MNLPIYTTKVVYTDGSDVTLADWTYLPVVQIHAERQFGKPILPMLAEGYIEPGYFGMWFILKRDGRTPFGYEQWLDFVADFEIVDIRQPAAEPEDSGDKEDPKFGESEPAGTVSS